MSARPAERVAHVIAKHTSDEQGNALTVYWAHGAAWTNNPWQACQTDDRATAAREAAQWSDYWATKGYGSRAHVETFTQAELTAAERAYHGATEQPK